MSLILLVGLFVIGTVGFMILGGRSTFESFYLTSVILTTVGLKEGGPQMTRPELAWSVLLMLVGIGTVLYTTSIIVAFFVDGQLRKLFGRAQQMNRINSLKDHFIIVGFGRMGNAICQTLQYRGIPFVLLEWDEDRVREADGMDFLYLRGDAKDETMLMQAGIDRARGLATCLANDADNVLVTLTARGMSETLFITSRAEALETERKMVRAGANRVICPPVIGASRVTDILLNPQVEDILELDGHWPDLEISKLSMDRFPDAAGKTLSQLGLSHEGDTTVVAIVAADGSRRLNPPTDTVLGEGDEIVLVGSAGCLHDVVRHLGRAAA